MSNKSLPYHMKTSRNYGCDGCYGCDGWDAGGRMTTC